MKETCNNILNQFVQDEYFVQTWPTQMNSQFDEDWECFDSWKNLKQEHQREILQIHAKQLNHSPNKGQMVELAQENFNGAMNKMLRDALKEPARSKICRRSAHNPTQIFVGECEQLYNAFMANSGLRKEWRINFIQKTDDRFTVRSTIRYPAHLNKPEVDGKMFSCSTGKYAWYMKAGYENMFR